MNSQKILNFINRHKLLVITVLGFCFVVFFFALIVLFQNATQTKNIVTPKNITNNNETQTYSLSYPASYINPLTPTISYPQSAPVLEVDFKKEAEKIRNDFRAGFEFNKTEDCNTVFTNKYISSFRLEYDSCKWEGKYAEDWYNESQYPVIAFMPFKFTYINAQTEFDSQLDLALYFTVNSINANYTRCYLNTDNLVQISDSLYRFYENHKYGIFDYSPDDAQYPFYISRIITPDSPEFEDYKKEQLKIINSEYPLSYSLVDDIKYCMNVKGYNPIDISSTEMANRILEISLQKEKKIVQLNTYNMNLTNDKLREVSEDFLKGIVLE